MDELDGRGGVLRIDFNEFESGWFSRPRQVNCPAGNTKPCSSSNWPWKAPLPSKSPMISVAAKPSSRPRSIDFEPTESKVSSKKAEGRDRNIAREAWNWLGSKFDLGEMKEASICKSLGTCAGRFKATCPCNPQKNPEAGPHFGDPRGQAEKTHLSRLRLLEC